MGHNLNKKFAKFIVFNITIYNETTLQHYFRTGSNTYGKALCYGL